MFVTAKLYNNLKELSDQRAERIAWLEQRVKELEDELALETSMG